MSTYYEMRCDKCAEQGGHFTRQAWGWGNADLIENHKFLMAHADCYADDGMAAIRILSEHNDDYADDAATAKWEAHLREMVDVFPHSDDWEFMADQPADQPMRETKARWEAERRAQGRD